MSDRFTERLPDRDVAHDVRVVASFTSIWCDGHHRDRTRTSVTTDGAVLGVYGRRPPVLCAECAAHLDYAEKRRAFCPKDPKPFCAYCETHCYRSAEREWQQGMMRYAGPRSWMRGHIVDGLRHGLGALAHRRSMARRSSATDRGSGE
jgi:hypothetical protein